MFSSALVCLFVCQWDKVKICSSDFQKSGKVAHEENHYISVVIWISLSWVRVTFRFGGGKRDPSKYSTWVDVCYAALV